MSEMIDENIPEQGYDEDGFGITETCVFHGCELGEDGYCSECVDEDTKKAIQLSEE